MPRGVFYDCAAEASLGGAKIFFDYILLHILGAALALGEFLHGGAVFLAREEAEKIFPVGEPR